MQYCAAAAAPQARPELRASSRARWAQVRRTRQTRQSPPDGRYRLLPSYVRHRKHRTATRVWRGQDHRAPALDTAARSIHVNEPATSERQDACILLQVTDIILCFPFAPLWKGGREVECAGLEIRYTGFPYRGFESHPFRQNPSKNAPFGAFFICTTLFAPTISLWLDAAFQTARDERVYAQQADSFLRARP